MATLEFRNAIREALDEALAEDDRVVFFGEDVAAAGGVFAVTGGLLEKHGPTRVFDTPISELALTGAAFGSAVCGLRPVIEIMFGDFLALAMDGLVNQAAKFFYLSAEQASVPLVVRSAVGGGRTLRGDPLADPGGLVSERTRAEDRRPGHRVTREGVAQGVDPR